jgi:hypothetical protein
MKLPDSVEGSFVGGVVVGEYGVELEIRRVSGRR